MAVQEQAFPSPGQELRWKQMIIEPQRDRIARARWRWYREEK